MLFSSDGWRCITCHLVRFVESSGHYAECGFFFYLVFVQNLPPRHEVLFVNNV